MVGLTLVFIPAEARTSHPLESKQQTRRAQTQRILRYPRNDKPFLFGASSLRQHIHPPQKFHHARVAAVHGEFAGLTLRDDSLVGSIKHDDPVGKFED